MRSHLQKILGLGMVLCLGLTPACVKVDVSVRSLNGSGSISNDDSWISIAELKKRHTRVSCNPSAWEIAREPQETLAWCWAASTRIVMEHFNKDHGTGTDSQCDIVNKTSRSLSSEATCCNTSIPAECIQGGWPSRVFDYYGFNYKKLAGALNDWGALTGEICSAGPFISVIEWNGGGKHTLVVQGYRYDSNSESPEKVVSIYDPLTDDFQDVIFDEFTGGSLPQANGFIQFSHYLNYVQIQPMTEDRS
jgi:hypothetical protein